MKLTIALAIGLYVLSLTPAHADGPPPYPSFTADTEMTAGGNTQEGKIAFGKGRMRMDMTIGDKAVSSIFDYSAKKMYTLLPPPIGCMEQAIRADPKDPFAVAVGQAEEEAIGEETIDGHPTKKVRVTTTVDGKKHTSLVWKATDLKNLPVRVAAEDGSFEMNYKNIELGEPDAKRVTPPGDCKANPFAGMMQRDSAAAPKKK